MLVGLFARLLGNLAPMPQFVLLYVGDAIWAMLVFWLVCFLKPQWPLIYQLLAALTFAGRHRILGSHIQERVQTRS